MQKLAKSSSLQVYYEDLVYLESTLSADEENTALSTLAKTAKSSKDDIIKLQDEAVSARQRSGGGVLPKD